MKYLKTFESYITPEERDINDMLDDMNRKKNNNTEPEIYPQINDNDSNNDNINPQINDNDNDSNNDNINSELNDDNKITPEQLESVINSFLKYDFENMTHKMSTFINNHQYIKTDPELKYIWWNALKKWHLKSRSN